MPRPANAQNAVRALLAKSLRPMSAAAIHRALMDSCTYASITSALRRMHDELEHYTISGVRHYSLKPSPPRPSLSAPTHPNGAISRIEIARELDALLSLIGELRRKV